MKCCLASSMLLWEIRSENFNTPVLFKYQFVFFMSDRHLKLLLTWLLYLLAAP